MSSISPMILSKIAQLLRDQPVTTNHSPNYYSATPLSSTPPQSAQKNGGSPSLPSGLLKQFMGGQTGGYTLGSAPQGGYGGYAGYADTLPGFEASAGAAPEGGYGGYAGYAQTLPGLEGAAGGGADAAGGQAAGGSGFGGMGAFALPLVYAAAIGMGKNTEANHPNTPGGDASLGLLGPSAAQIIKDPKGMGLPALLGVPFLAPFTASDEAKREKPEFSGIFGLGF